MPRIYSTAQPGYRICNRCRQELPANSDVFIRDKTRPMGIAYECRECHRARKLGRDNRSDRYALMTPEQRAMNRTRQKRYHSKGRGRAIMLRKAYARNDECDLSTEEVMALIEQPCVHCGTTEINRGLDRIDNSRGHLKGNVVTSCAPCNFARGDRFTFTEMQEIGATIRDVLSRRSNQG